MIKQHSYRLAKADLHELNEHAKRVGKPATHCVREAIVPAPKNARFSPQISEKSAIINLPGAIHEKLLAASTTAPSISRAAFLRHCLGEYLAEKMGIVLALDFGAKMGWAYRASNGQIKSGTEKLATGKDVRYGLRFAAMARFLRQIRLENGRFKAIAFEKVMAHKGVIAAHAYGGYEATLAILALEHGVTLAPYGVTEVKKSFTGNGMASKAEMIRIAEMRGFKVADDNEADALAVLTHHEGVVKFGR